MSDKLREEFEAWRLEKFCGGEDRLRKCSNAPDVYYYTAEQEAWKVWQASRAALVVELPGSAMVYFNGAPESAYKEGIACWHGGVNSARAAIEDAGVRVRIKQ